MSPTDEIGSARSTRTIASYFGAFAPAPEWDALARWPPDVFALASLVLDHTESYRFVVAPPPRRRWPPFENWADRVRHAAGEWTESVRTPSGQLPPLVRQLWQTVTTGRDMPLSELRRGDAWELASALLTLHAIADETCADVAVGGDRRSPDSFDDRAWRLLQRRGSLSRLSPTRVRIVPKTHFASRGITIRSLSRHLALCYESVDVRWRSAEPRPRGQGDYNIVLLPWPLAIKASDFKPVPSSTLENIDSELFGFFEFAPDAPVDCATVRSVLNAALEAGGRVDAVVLPEAAIDPGGIAELECALVENGVSLLIAGVREPRTDGSFGRNYLHFGTRTAAGWHRYEQDKHHRWCLDGPQILQYHLTRSLQPSKRWWEAIDVRERTLHIIDVGDRITTAPMVCEDLARLDEVADLVRRIGPTLIVALLLDGPQLASRWPVRYASLLVDDPGSTVLTLTAHGMVSRSRPPGHPPSRVIAHWNSRSDGVHEIALDRGATGVLVRAVVETSVEWTADGRDHTDIPQLGLDSVIQLRHHPRRLHQGNPSRRHTNRQPSSTTPRGPGLTQLRP